MPSPVDPDNLRKFCLFCDPVAQRQGDQVLLRSDHFYLFAGLGPIVEGYIIIAPNHCEIEQGGLSTLSDASGDLLDELLFLRGLVFSFYKEAYGTEGGLCFEHGRAGTSPCSS